MAWSEEDILTRALEKRAPVLRGTDAWRWLDVDAEPHGVTVERYGAYAVLHAYSTQGAAARERWAQALLRLGVSGVYYKYRVRDDLRKVPRAEVAPAEPLWGEAAPDPLLVRENGLSFSVRLGDGFSTGLFLDQRDNRQRIRQLASGKQVLNLFSYTGAFSVAAGAGGAVRVTSVDLSGAVLRRLSDNLENNRLLPTQHRVLRADCVSWVRRAVRRGDVYDVVVLDPPSFGSDGKKTWSVERDYFGLVQDTLGVVAPGGTLLCVTNHRGTSVSTFRGRLEEAVRGAGRTLRALELPAPPLDCRPQLSTEGRRTFQEAGEGGSASQGATKSAMVSIQ